MSNLVFIPVRIGSKGINKKNIKPFNGKPLVLWSLFAAQNAKKVDRIILASDSEEINEIVESAHLSKVTIFRRSSKNSSDTASTESVMLEFLKQETNIESTLVLVFTITILAVLLIKSTSLRSRYYTSFLVESVPIIALILTLFLN